MYFDESGALKMSKKTSSISDENFSEPVAGGGGGKVLLPSTSTNTLVTPQRSEIAMDPRLGGSETSISDGLCHTPTSSYSTSGDPVVHRIFNKRVMDPLPDSCFIELAESYDAQVFGKPMTGTYGIRRNISWQGELSFASIPRVKSENVVGRRHTAVVVMNSDSDEDDESDSIGTVVRSKSVQRKLSHVYERHYVHLKKLKDQMGDSSAPPKDLLSLMARKMFVSQATTGDEGETVSQIDDRLNACSLGGSNTSHDLEECSSRLPKIRTGKSMGMSCHL